MVVNNSLYTKLCEFYNKLNKELRDQDQSTLNEEERWFFFLFFFIIGCIFSQGKQTGKESGSRLLFLSFFRELEKNKYTFSISQLKEKLSHLPNIFFIPPLFDNQFVEKLSQISLTQDLITDFLDNIWTSIQFKLDETNDNVENEIVSPFIISHLFDQYHSHIQKHTVQKGAFFSPDSDVIFLCKNILDIQSLKRTQSYQNNTKNHSPQVILDPTVGSGVFIYHLLSQYWNLINPEERLNPDFWPIFTGMDINPLALIITKFRIWSFFYLFLQNQRNSDKTQDILIQQIGYLYEQKFFFSQGDFLFDIASFTQQYIQKFDLKDIQKEIFDLILGNPPYIRYRDITDPYQNHPIKNQLYRMKLLKIIPQLINPPQRWDRQADYYLYFILQGLEYLKKGGILAFIISNSWMNVQYGSSFRDYLCRNFLITQIHNNLYRSFKHAEINTIHLIIEKPVAKNVKSPLNHYVKLINWNNSYQQLLNISSINKSPLESKEIIFNNSTLKISKDNYSRILSVLQKDLLIKEKNTDEISLHILNLGDYWATLGFFAPDFYFSLFSHIQHKICLLGDIAKIKRGITTNCNYFYVLEKDGPNYRNGFNDIVNLEERSLIPLLESPRQLIKPLIDINQLNTRLLYLDQDLDKLKSNLQNQTVQYIQYGMKKKIILKKGTKRGNICNGVHQLASFISKYQKSPTNWYCLKPRSIKKGFSKIFIQKIYNTTYKVAYSELPLLVNNTFYEIHLKEEYQGMERLIIGLLLSTITFLSIELYGRTNFGGGALDTATFDIAKILLLSPEKLSQDVQNHIIQLSTPLLNRPFFSIEKELNMLDRQALDHYILQLLPVPILLEELYSVISQIQQFRIIRSKSFKNLF